MMHSITTRGFCASVTTILLLLTSVSFANASQNQRIITLSPHLTEIVFALGKGDSIVAVSDFSDYPLAAKGIRSVASYQGANIAEIIRLQPTHILVWRGGNKDVDITKLRDQGFMLYESVINTPAQLLVNIEEIGKFIGANMQAQDTKKRIESQLLALKRYESNDSLRAIYYLNQKPMTGLGNDAWLNSLLTLCNISNIYKDNIAPYPQLQIADVIRQQPDLIIAGDGATVLQAEVFWRTHAGVLNKPIVSANPNAMHRFTMRAIDETAKLCASAHSAVRSKVY